MVIKFQHKINVFTQRTNIILTFNVSFANPESFNIIVSFLANIYGLLLVRIGLHGNFFKPGNQVELSDSKTDFKKLRS